MQIYVASLSDYNAGRLHGAWINLEKFTDAESVLEHIQETILATSPEAAATGFPAEEWAIHGYEEAPTQFGEYESLETLMDVQFWINKIQENGSDIDAIAAYLEHFDLDSLDRFEDRYHGEGDSEEDYEKFARDLFINDYTYQNGYVFSLY